MVNKITKLCKMTNFYNNFTDCIVFILAGIFVLSFLAGFGVFLAAPIIHVYNSKEISTCTSRLVPNALGTCDVGLMFWVIIVVFTVPPLTYALIARTINKSMPLTDHFIIMIMKDGYGITILLVYGIIGIFLAAINGTLMGTPIYYYIYGLWCDDLCNAGYILWIFVLIFLGIPSIYAYLMSLRSVVQIKKE